jgi:hypothetical protein
MKNFLLDKLKILRINEPRAHMVVLCCVFTLLALTLWFQPERFSNTPSYANLLNILRQHTWAVLYAIPAILMMVSLKYYMLRGLVIVTHTLTGAMLIAWEYAFIVRWITDSGTTIVNVLSWFVLIYLLIRSAVTIDDYTRMRGINERD